MAVATATILAGAALGLGAVGFVKQQEAAEDQRDAAKKQYEAEKKRADIQNVRAVRQQIREQRAAAGSIVARGATTGTSGSSGVAGGVASTQSQLAGNLNYMSDMAGANAAIGQAQLAFGQASGDMAMGAALQGLGGTIFSAAGGFSAFGPSPAPNTAGQAMSLGGQNTASIMYNPNAPRL